MDNTTLWAVARPERSTVNGPLAAPINCSPCLRRAITVSAFTSPVTARVLPESSTAGAVMNGPALHQASGLQQHRSEEHTSELQSRPHLVCRLLLEKKTTSTFGIENCC